MSLPREQSAGYLVNHLGRQFAVLLANRLKPLGLAPAQHAVLLALWQEDGLSQRELVNILEIRQATAANTLDRMERAASKFSLLPRRAGWKTKLPASRATSMPMRLPCWTNTNAGNFWKC